MMINFCGYVKNSYNLTLVRRPPEWLNRTYATKKAKKSKKYSHTIMLPSTDFPARIEKKDRVALDQKIEKDFHFYSLYNWQRNNINGPEYVLHDGPPYANGSVHIGHAINKVLKDITIRYHLLNGRKIHFKPGWDCHGLPIELKALSTAESESNSMPAVDIRKKARAFAAATIEEQKKTFKTWGLLADWEKGCYYTYDKHYVQNQLRQFYKLYEKGLVYRDLKPVYWSPSSRTALAEAELEYNENHISKAVTVRFKVDISTVPNEFAIPNGSNLYALIWTTTPWTLPSNQAVAFNEKLMYSLVKIDNSVDHYIIANDLITELEKLIGKCVSVVSTISSSSLNSLRYQHQFQSGKTCPFVPGTHVRSSKGTGLVHIAPAHGPEDFVLGLEFKLPLKCIIDEAGCYTKDAGELHGIDVEAGNDMVIKKLDSDIVHVNEFTHSYPYDWRTKKPVIIRCSEQWFIDTQTLKEKAAECLEHVKVEPPNHSSKLYSLLQSRPFWCISRQRVWGVPIPVLYDPQSGAVINKDLIEHYCTLIDRHGTDFWWNLSVPELIPPDSKLSNPDSLVKSNDILDIWFDSGISWSSVLEGAQVADLYVEGMDQCSGWFQSSLLLSVGLRNIPPYRGIYIHGFAVDSNLRKMSKSLGNIVEPQDIIEGKGKLPPYGIDVLRWWVAYHCGQHHHIRVTEDMLTKSEDDVHKLRRLIRFLLGTMKQPNCDESKSYSILDRYMLHRLFEFHHQVKAHYEQMQLCRACFTIIDFISNDISSNYVYVTKDRLYCEAAESDYRTACQEICFCILNVLLRAIAPIVPHLAEEAHSFMTTDRTPYYRKKHENLPETWKDPDAVRFVEKVLNIKKAIVESQPTVDANLLHLAVRINASDETIELLERFTSKELLDILQVSTVTLCKCTDEEDFRIEVENTNKTMCARCRRYACINNEELCSRCASVVTMKSLPNT